MWGEQQHTLNPACTTPEPSLPPTPTHPTSAPSYYEIGVVKIPGQAQHHWAVGESWGLFLLSSPFTGAGGANSHAWLDSGKRCLKEEQHVLLGGEDAAAWQGWCWKSGDGAGMVGMVLG